MTYTHSIQNTKSTRVPLVVGLACAAIGSVLLAIPNNSIQPLYGVPLFATLGVLVVYTFIRGYGTIAGFCLSFGVCTLAAGLSQLHMEGLQGHPLGDSDALGFYAMLRKRPPYLDMQEIQRYNDGPIAILIWQYVYRAANGLGFSHLPWTGVGVNAMLTALAVSISIATAQLIPWFTQPRLYRLVILLGINGLLMLSGALFVREAYALIINALLVWCYAYSIKSKSVASFVFSAFVTALGCLFMWYLRDRAVALIVVLFVAYTGIWAIGGRFSGRRFLTLLITLFVLTIAGISLLEAFGVGKSYMLEEAEKYSNFSQATARKDSLGVKFVTGQPLPIRIVTGTLFQVLNPVPLWGTLKFDAHDYHLIKSWQGIYFVSIFPFFLTGAWFALKGLNAGARASNVLVFLAVYSLLSLMAIAATSTETRHFAQFTAPLVVVASSVDIASREQHHFLRRIGTAWYGGVIMIHVLWIILRLS